MKEYLRVVIFICHKIQPSTDRSELPLELAASWFLDSDAEFLYDSDRFEDDDELVGLVRLERFRGVAAA